MNEFIGWLAIEALIALLLGSLWCFLRDRAYRDGYSRGRTDADKWWIETDAAVNQAQQKIWREE
jgi:hypothetical protein